MDYKYDNKIIIEKNRKLKLKLKSRTNKKWINNLRLQTIKTLQIQRHWRNCTSNPEYKLAQKLITANIDKN